MSELEDVRYGWDFMARMLGADVAVIVHFLIT